MNRWDILNKLIEVRNYKSFLEIGTYRFWNFDNVKCFNKVTVDPYPCKSPEMEKLAYGGGNILFENSPLAAYTYNSHNGSHLEIFIKLTSDDFFSKLSNDEKWQLHFIDGLHECPQVYKDIMNCLHHLEEGGTVCLHDLNPPLYEHTISGIDGCWTGDAYKAFLQFRSENYIGFAEKYECFVVDSDWGVGVIQERKDKRVKSLEKFELEKESYQKAINDWEYFDQNRKELLNLISVEEFQKRMAEEWGNREINKYKETRDVEEEFKNMILSRGLIHNISAEENITYPDYPFSNKKES